MQISHKWRSQVVGGSKDLVVYKPLQINAQYERAVFYARITQGKNKTKHQKDGQKRLQENGRVGFKPRRNDHAPT